MQKIIQKNYIDSDGKILAKELREEINWQLSEMATQAEYLLSSLYKQFWQLLHHHLVNISNAAEKEAYLDIEAQLVTLPIFINSWKRTAVATPETFEMFVMTKASEIRSGNKDGDYYWALAIRHDQLLALTRVLKALLANMTKWVKLKPTDVIEDGVFLGISEYNLEKQIYLESEKVHQERILNGNAL